MLIPIILAGGSGQRLWPVSRELHPKPFMELGDGESLIQKSFVRAGSLPGVSRALIVTNQEYFFKSREAISNVEARLPEHVAVEWLLEPEGRNTAAAIAVATTFLTNSGHGDATVVVMPADHCRAHRIGLVVPPATD